MEYRFLGDSGLKVSALSFGAWVTFGPQMTAIIGGNGSGKSGADGQIARDMIQ